MIRGDHIPMQSVQRCHKCPRIEFYDMVSKVFC